MAIQTIERNDPFGRIGKSFGEGLSEQIPKEIQQQRLSQGLKKFAQEAPNRDTLTNFAELGSIYGIPESYLHTFGKLARDKGVRGEFLAKGRPGAPQEVTSAQTPHQGQQGQQNDISQVQFANLKPRKATPGREQLKNPSDYQTEEEFANAQTNINEKHPLRKEAIVRNPWTKEERDADIAREYAEHPNLDYQEILARSKDNEARYLAQPEAEQSRDEQYKKVKAEADDEFQKKLELKLQKKGEDIFKDIPGTMQNELRKGMYRDIVKGMTPEKAADKWSEIGLNQAKDQASVDKLANQNVLDALNREVTRNKLKGYQKSYAAAGNQSGFSKMLQSNNKPAVINEKGQEVSPREFGFSMSPQGGDYIAYPRSKKVNEVLTTYKISTTPIDAVRSAPEKARKIAVALENVISADQSWLAIAQELRFKDPYFDEASFFNQLREDMDDFGWTPDQKRQINEGESGFVPAWGDFWVLPFFK